MHLLPKQTELVKFNDGKILVGKQKPRWFALVLNTEAGLKWIENFRKKNTHLKIRLRARHSNRRLAYKLAGIDYDSAYREHTVPRKFAERFAIYIEEK